MMNIQIKSAAKCPTCGAALHIGAEDHSARCRYCQTLVEISRFTQEEKRLVRAIEEMRESLSEAEKRMEEAVEEFARTGTSAAGAQQRQAEAQYQSLMDALEQKQSAYENAQARKMGGWFRLGEEAQRARRYEEAIGHYQKILAVCEEEAEVHWRVLMCRYGVEYVRDQLTGTYLPTLTRMQVDDIGRDADYIAACKFAQDADVRSYYQQEGERLSGILTKYQHIHGTTKPYDVFISVKQGDDEGKPTQDSMTGMNLYYQLTAQGLNVFNSRVSLKAGEEYEPYIMHALMTAKVLVVVASSEEYLNSRWLRNEWRRFAWLKKSEGVQSERKIIVYSCAQGMLKIPAEIGAVQIIDEKRAVAPVEALYRSVREVCGKGANAGEESVVPAKNVVPAEPTQNQEKQIKKAAKDGEKQSKKEQKTAQKQEKKGVQPTNSENRASAGTSAADVSTHKGRNFFAEYKWVLCGLGAAAVCSAVVHILHYGTVVLIDQLQLFVRLIGLWALSKKKLQVKRTGGRIYSIAWAGLIGLLVWGAGYLIDTRISGIIGSILEHRVLSGYMTAGDAAVVYKWTSLLGSILRNFVLSAVCVKIADRLTAARRELVLSVVGWMMVAGASIIRTIINGMIYGGFIVLNIVMTVLVNVCLIAGTALWLRERKAKA